MNKQKRNGLPLLSTIRNHTAHKIVENFECLPMKIAYESMNSDCLFKYLSFARSHRLAHIPRLSPTQIFVSAFLLFCQRKYRFVMIRSTYCLA